MKKILAIFLLLSFLLTSIIPSAFAETDRKQFEISLDSVNKFDSWDVSDKHSGANTEGSNISFQTGEWTEYDLNITRAGSYNMYVQYGSIGKLTVEIHINGSKKLEAKFDASGGYSNQKNGLVGCVYLSEGKNTVRVYNASGSVYFRYFSVEYFKPFSVGMDEDLKVDSSNVFDRHPGATTEGSSISFQGGEWTYYEIDVKDSGYYGISVTYGFPGELFVCRAIIDGDEENPLEKDFGGTGDYGIFETGMVGRVWFDEGVHSVKIVNGGGSLYFRYFAVGYLKDIDVSEILAGDVDASEENAVIPRGTDSFEIKFNQKHDKETVTDDSVKLLNGEEELPTDISTDGETITVNLLKTLDYETEYKFVLEGIKDSLGFTALDKKEFTFLAGDKDNDEGVAVFEVTETAFDGRSIFIKGVMKSSKGIAIEGRKAEIYAISPSGNRSEIPECSAVSNEKGEVVLEGELCEDAESGYYKLDLVFEYRQSDLFVEMIYVSSAKEKELAETLKASETKEKVASFFEENKKMLGLDIDNDTIGLDKNEIFNYFVENKPESFAEIRSDYYKYLAMEKINQATETKELEKVFEDVASCEILGIETGKLALLEDAKETMLDEILALDAIRDEESFDEKISEVFEKHYALKYGVAEGLAFAEDSSVDKGQTIFVNLGFTESRENVTGATFAVNVSDKDLLEECTVKAEAPFEAEIAVEGNTAFVTFTSKAPVSDVTKMGDFCIVNTEKTGAWTVSVSGKLKVDVNTDYDAIVPLKEVTVNVSATENNNKTEGTNSSTPSGVNRGNGGGSGGGASVPVIPDIPSSQPESKFEFTDLGTAEWAKESIYSLLDAGVLSKSDDNKFNPDNNVTRAEFVKMLICGLDLLGENENCSFDDVSPRDWYYQYVGAALRLGLVTGDENGNFNPNGNITRQDMSAIIYRILSKLGYSFDESEYGEAFSDDEMISSYAKDAVYSMKVMGIINGVGDGMFAPKMHATRAQSAKIICETVKVVNK